jgi:serine/threonine-protein kinase HipA
VTALAVSLGAVPVGTILLRPDGSAFVFDAGYLDRPRRPVLGQWFEDRLGRQPRESKRPLPEWFENVLPERSGRVRRRIAHELGCAEEDDAALIVALGEDLPGAVRVGPVAIGTEVGPLAAPRASVDISPGLRASLGGFQLKFTLSGGPDRLTLPVADDDGDRWILKIAPESAFPRLAHNEAAVSQWLAAAGFQVPEVHVLPRSAFPELGELDSDMIDGFLIRRFDRSPGHRVHQEDFLQVLGRSPLAKYDATDAVGLGRLIHAVVGPAGVEEYLRRTIAVVGTGNVDAHLKNWSLLYPDGVRPVLSPLYDQVATIPYPDLGTRLALRIGSAKSLGQVDLAHVEFLGSKLGVEARVVGVTVDAVLSRLTASFDPDALGFDPSLAHRLREHWARVPLLRAHQLR